MECLFGANGFDPTMHIYQKLYGCFLKWWYPHIIHFKRVFHYKPSILGYPYFWKHPYIRHFINTMLYKVQPCIYKHLIANISKYNNINNNPGPQPILTLLLFPFPNRFSTVSTNDCLFYPSNWTCSTTGMVLTIHHFKGANTKSVRINITKTGVTTSETLLAFARGFWGLGGNRMGQDTPGPGPKHRNSDSFGCLVTTWIFVNHFYRV